MEYSGSIHYFVDANSSAGYVDRYESTFGGLKQVEQLCDFPDETAERLLFYVQNKAAEKNLRTEVIHNCLTNRPMGILLPELSRGVINRQTWRPGALSALASLDNAALNGVRSAVRRGKGARGRRRGRALLRGGHLPRPGRLHSKPHRRPGTPVFHQGQARHGKVHLAEKAGRRRQGGRLFYRNLPLLAGPQQL